MGFRRDPSLLSRFILPQLELLQILKMSPHKELSPFVLDRLWAISPRTMVPPDLVEKLVCRNFEKLKSRATPWFIQEGKPFNEDLFLRRIEPHIRGRAGDSR